MKKLLSTFIAISFATAAIFAQDAAPESKSVRFGVVVRGTPSWYNMPTNNNNYYKGGAVFGYGFGLNLEFKLSDVVSLQTGIGGDFDGGKIKYTYSGNGATGLFTGYYLDKTPKAIEIKNQNPADVYATYVSGKSSVNYLQDRHIHTTYVTIPVVLKMMTKEISGFKYFVDFGANIGVLASATATDNVIQDNPSALVNLYPEKNSGLNIYKDCIPVRVGLNVGGGAEFRLAGTTSLFLSANFINSFIPTLKSTSVYNATGVDFSQSSSGNFVYAKQNVKPMGVQINIGIMF